MPLFRQNLCNRGSPQFLRLTQLAVFLSAFSIAASAQAATYYVATNGSDSNPGTIDAPWQTMKKAFASVRGGETVYFRAGTYAAATIKNVNPPTGQWITFKPYSGENVVIDTKKVGNYIGSLIVVDSSYLVFDGFHITSSNFNPAIFNCKLKYIDNNNGDPCYDAWGGDHHVGIQLNPSDQEGVSQLVHHLVFQNNEIHHNMGHGILGAANDVKFLNNHIHHNGRYATYVDGDNWIMRGNELDHNWGDGFRVGNTNDTGSGPVDRFYGVNFLIEQNYIHDALGPQVGPGGKIFDSIDAAFWGMSGGIIRNNIRGWHSLALMLA